MHGGVALRPPGRIACSASMLAVLVGCGQALEGEQVDFGAGVVARYVVAAQEKCNAAGIPDLYECAEVPSSGSGERLAARVALDAYQIFQRNCREAAGAGQCEALADTAYRNAKAQESRPLGGT